MHRFIGARLRKFTKFHELNRTVVLLELDYPEMQQYNCHHYNDVIMSTMASQITSLAIVYSNVYSRRRSKKHQSSPSLAFVRGIHRWPVNFPHKWPVTRKMFPLDDVIIISPVRTLLRLSCFEMMCSLFRSTLVAVIDNAMAILCALSLVI